MASSISRTEKRSRGRPRTHATSIHLTTPPDVLAALDLWIADQPDPKPTRPEAVRLALRDWLTGLGLLPPKPESEANGR
jgi:hypothetical protein